GFPVIHVADLSKRIEHSSRCGCSAEDREAGRCCCNKVAATHSCCEPEPVSCCQSAAANQEKLLVTRWQGPVVSQHCKGPTDRASAQSESPSIPSHDSTTLVIESPFIDQVPIQTQTHAKLIASPDVPPPRLPSQTI